MPDPRKALEAMQAALNALDPLEPEERQRAMTWLAETLDVAVIAGNPTKEKAARGAADNSAPDGSNDLDAANPKQFLAAKAPNTDVERMTCLAYYLTKFRKVQSFKTADLTALNTEAAGHRFSNAAATARNAVNQNGYFAQAGGGSRQITALGEKVAEALPDREAVADVISKTPKRRRRSGSRSAKSAK
jgi:hypothetical protein